MRTVRVFLAGLILSAGLALGACGQSNTSDGNAQTADLKTQVTFKQEFLKCKPDKAIYEAYPELLEKYVASNAVPAHDLLLKLGMENQTLTIGEIHSNTREKSYVSRLIPELARTAGLGYLAIEVDSKFQPDIDAFSARKISAQEFDNRIETLKYSATSEMIEAASHTGMKVVAIDSHPIRSGGNFGFELSRANDDVTDLLIDRDASMHNIMQERIFKNDPWAKVLVYIGNLHVFESTWGDGYSSLGGYLQRYTGEGNASVFITDTTSGISGIIEGIYLGDMMGITTDTYPIEGMLFSREGITCADNMDIMYGKHLDAIIAIRN